MGAGAAAWAGPAIQSVAGTMNGIANIWGGNKVKQAQTAANNKARTDLTQGYNEGKGFQQPIYDTGLKNYTDLSSSYAGGKFDNGHMDAYKFDPQSVFQDPEYQAQMKAGGDAINGSAQANSMLFSGEDSRDLTKFGQDTFAGRSDALYNRGFNAQNTAFNQNALTNQTNFNEGNALVQPLAASSGKLTDLSVMQGGDLANNDLAAGAIRTGNINNTTGQLVGINSNLANQSEKSINNMFGGGFMPKSGGK